MRSCRRLSDGRKPKTNPLNENFEKKEFQELWRRINQKAVYRVEFDSEELVRKCVSALDSQLRVTPLQYTVQTGHQGDGLTDEQLKAGDGFALTRIDDRARRIGPFAREVRPPREDRRKHASSRARPPPIS